MSLDSSQSEALFNALLAKGWFWRDEFIVAPNETMWLFRTDPWEGDLSSFHESMIGRRQRIIRNVDAHDDKSQHKNAVDDITSLIDSLESLIPRI